MHLCSWGARRAAQRIGTVISISLDSHRRMEQIGRQTIDAGMIVQRLWSIVRRISSKVGTLSRFAALSPKNPSQRNKTLPARAAQRQRAGAKQQQAGQR